MGKKNRNKRNRLEKKRRIGTKIDSNPGGRWSISISYVRKELELELDRNEEDRISGMHDDILSHVISFLPFESAIQTSFLSTRWRDVWKRNFCERKGTTDDAFAAITSFLYGCVDGYSEQRPTSDWGFVFNLGGRSFISVAAEPDKALQLDFSNVRHEFPWRFDWFLDINGPAFGYWFDLQSSLLPFEIKTLHLKSVSYIFSGAISSMMINFKFLERLTIEKCPGLRSLKLEGGTRLKKLTILDCQQLESLHLNVFSLQSLRFRGRLLSLEGAYGSSFWFSPWFSPWFNGFELADAMLDFRQGPCCSNIRSCGFQSFFCVNKDVKSLTLSGWIFEPLIFPMLQLRPFPRGLRFNRLKELSWIDYSKERFNSNALISCLKFCPRLTRLYVTIDPKSHRRTTRTTNYSVEFTSVLRLEDLKVVKLEGFPMKRKRLY